MFIIISPPEALRAAPLGEPGPDRRGGPAGGGRGLRKRNIYIYIYICGYQTHMYVYLSIYIYICHK